MDQQEAFATGLYPYDDKGMHVYDTIKCHPQKTVEMTATQLIRGDLHNKVFFLCSRDVSELSAIHGVDHIEFPKARCIKPSDGAIRYTELREGQKVIVTSGDPIRFRGRYRFRYNIGAITMLVFLHDSIVIHVMEAITKLDRPD